MRDLKSILIFILLRLQDKSFKIFSNVFLVCLIILVSQIVRLCLFGWDCSIDLLIKYIRSVFYLFLWDIFQHLFCNVFYFVIKMFVTTIWLHHHFKSAFSSFLHAISTEVRAWRHFSLLVERVFCHSRDYCFGPTWLTSLTKMTSSLWRWLYFISKRKVMWMRGTLNEGFLR